MPDDIHAGAERIGWCYCDVTITLPSTTKRVQYRRVSPGNGLSQRATFTEEEAEMEK